MYFHIIESKIGEYQMSREGEGNTRTSSVNRRNFNRGIESDRDGWNPIRDDYEITMALSKTDADIALRANGKNSIRDTADAFSLCHLVTRDYYSASSNYHCYYGGIPPISMITTVICRDVIPHKTVIFATTERTGALSRTRTMCMCGYICDSAIEVDRGRNR